MSILPYEYLRSIELARPAILAWILPALVVVLGVSIGIRGFIALRWLRQQRCPRCGYEIARVGASVATCCSECGLAVAHSGWPYRRRMTALLLKITFGLVVTTFLLQRLLQHELVRPVVLLFLTSGVGIVILVLIVRGRHGVGRRKAVAIVAIALLLQAPWVFLAWRYHLHRRADGLVAQWTALGVHAGSRSQSGGQRDPLLEWITGSWRWAFGSTGVWVAPTTDAEWSALEIGPPEQVLSIGIGLPNVPPPTAKQLRSLTRFTDLVELQTPWIFYSDDRLQALRALPARLRIGGEVHDLSGQHIGRLVDSGDEVWIEWDEPVRGNSPAN